MMNKKRLRSRFYGIILCSLMLLMLTSCSSGKSINKNISIKDMDEKIKESVDISNMEVGNIETLEELYDINNDDLEEFLLYIPAINIKANEIAVLKVKDAKKIDEIKEKAIERVDNQATIFEDYLPEEYYLIEKHLLKVKDNYILFVISEETDTIEKIFDESFK